jgi:hypothetical protein
MEQQSRHGSAHWDAARRTLAADRCTVAPAAPDVEYLRDIVSRLTAFPHASTAARTALLLGVRPEIAEIAWEPVHRLVAVDTSEGTVNAIWPGDTPTRRGVVGDWLALDLPTSPRAWAGQRRFVGTIEGYRGIDERYSFSTEREVVGSLAAAFELLETWRPSYELGERCPHVTFRRRG